MRFLNLKVNNLGVFGGQNSFNLVPSIDDSGNHRCIVIISGHNGSGKSTLFNSIRLALLGPAAIGDRIQRENYNDFLLSLMHQGKKGNCSPKSTDSGLELELEFIRSGRPSLIRIARNWCQSQGDVKESLVVWENEVMVAHTSEEAQAWLNDIVPPGFASLCFFNAEKADDDGMMESDSKLSHTILDRILGLNLVEKLQSDLNYYLTHRTGSTQIDQLLHEIENKKVVLVEVDQKLEQLTKDSEECSRQETALTTELRRQEQQLASEGGAYSARRLGLQERLAQVQPNIEEITEKLRDYCSGLLPFALVPELCNRLANNLANEANSLRRQIADAYLRTRLSNLESVVREDRLWERTNITPEGREELTSHFLEIVKNVVDGQITDDVKLIHQLSENESQKLQTWISESLHSLPMKVGILREQLVLLRNECQCIEAELNRVPDADILAPIHAEITHLQVAKSDLQQRRDSIREQIGVHQFRREEHIRGLKKLNDQLVGILSQEREITLANRCNLVLTRYRVELARQRLLQLEDSLVSSFNTICQKDQLLKSVHINPSDFAMRLEGFDGQELCLRSLSAGEHQLFSLALFRALRLVGASNLPLAVDTPFARLDLTHRIRAINDYYPVVSEQVLLFVTDTELTDDLIAKLNPYTARSYRLCYSSSLGQTMIDCTEQANYIESSRSLRPEARMTQPGDTLL